MEALLGWLMLASWIAIVWMMWRVVQDGREALRAHRTSLHANVAPRGRHR
jgi:hypothetical protein